MSERRSRRTRRRRNLKTINAITTNIIAPTLQLRIGKVSGKRNATSVVLS